MAAGKTAPIIVIKKKSGHGGHHGGAWKVAYADFVTAMMSLFIVLWLMGSSDKVKKAVAGYFNDPKGTGGQLGTMLSGTGKTVAEMDSAELEQLKEKIEEQIKARKELQKLAKQVEMTITPEGLRIELLESKDATFFEVGSAKLSQNGQELLGLLAHELQTLPNSMLLEGHTDAKPYANGNSGYSNWDLSADRANTARRILQEDGVRDNQVTQVRGYADQMLRVKSDPLDPSNRRISILVKNASESVPTFTSNGILSGKTPLPGSPAAIAAEKAAAAAEAAKAEAEKKAGGKLDEGKKGEGKAAEGKPGEAAAKPQEKKGEAAKPTAVSNAPAAKPSLLDRIKAMLPGHKAAPVAAQPAAPAAATGAKPASPAASPSLMDRIKSWLPGHKAAAPAATTAPTTGQPAASTPTAPAAPQSLWDKIKAMLPGKKK